MDVPCGPESGDCGHSSQPFMLIQKPKNLKGRKGLLQTGVVLTQELLLLRFIWGPGTCALQPGRGEEPGAGLCILSTRLLSARLLGVQETSALAHRADSSLSRVPGADHVVEQLARRTPARTRLLASSLLPRQHGPAHLCLPTCPVLSSATKPTAITHVSPCLSQSAVRSLKQDIVSLSVVYSV